MNYKKRLNPFAEDWHRMQFSWRRRLEAMTPRERLRLIRDCDKVSTTNCWASTYEAAPAIKRAAVYEHQIMKQRQSTRAKGKGKR